MKHIWTPDKITAIIIVVGCLALIFCGINTEVKSILAIAAGWVFGGAYRAARDKTNTNGKAQ